MDLQERIGIVLPNVNNSQPIQTLSSHVFSDLSHVLPVVFVYLLTEFSKCGTTRGTPKFRALQQQLFQILKTSPKPGPATFVVQCLYVIAVLGHPYIDFYGNLVISSLSGFSTFQTVESDLIEAQRLTGKLFLDAINDLVVQEVHIIIKLLEAFDVRLLNIQEALRDLEMNDESDMARAYIESYVIRLIHNKWYLHAVTLLERFSIRLFDESFLLRMMQDRDFKPAEKWATFMGRPMVCAMVTKYIDMNMLKQAYAIIKANNLQHEFPDTYYTCLERSLQKLAEKGLWDIAEAETHGDIQLLEYLVYMAMEAGYSEKVEELCQRYSLNGFLKIKAHDIGPEGICSNSLENHYLDLQELAFDDLVWVDEIEGLLEATAQIEECKVIGIDCEWNPSNQSGKHTKVSIIQIAGEDKVFIFDLLKLSMDDPDMLNSCMKCILRSPRILKLGYNLHCDLKHLHSSYTDLECFKHYKMLLDVQNMFKEPRGGLSGLSKKILGAYLNKAIRDSNWEQRPLSKNQLEYAALDAAVVIRLFCLIRNQIQPSGSNNRDIKLAWRSSIVSHLDSSKLNKAKGKNKPNSKKVVGGGCSSLVPANDTYLFLSLSKLFLFIEPILVHLSTFISFY